MESLLQGIQFSGSTSRIAFLLVSMTILSLTEEQFVSTARFSTMRSVPALTNVIGVVEDCWNGVVEMEFMRIISMVTRPITLLKT